MAYETFSRRKFSLLTSTALTKQVAALGALGVVFGANSAFALDPNALPQDPNVVGGGATFNSSGATLTVNQSTNRTVIDWRSFDIGSNATTNFVQPGASSIAVNRVNASANPTEIQGSLNANGQVWILNPNGVLFGKTAKIDVAGIVASTANISVQTFMSGDTRLQLTGGDHGSVTNEGAITVADSGLAAFVAPSVRNSGVIQARVGRVTLAAGSTFTLDLAGDQLVEIGLGANNALVDQSGKILADGSRINLTAKSASAVVDSVVNVSGTVLASSVSEDGGTITLSADNVTTTSDAVLKADAGTNGNGGEITSYANKTGNYGGLFSAKGGSASGNGGFIETSGKKVQIAGNISVNTLADHGTTGDWTIDPDDLVIGAGEASAIVGNLATTNQTVTANNSITVNSAIDSSAQSNSNTLALNDENADNNLLINLNAQIKLGASQHLTGQGTTVNVANTGLIQNGVDVAKAGGATVNVAAGTYGGTTGVNVNKAGLTLSGAGSDNTIVNVNPGSGELNAFVVTANNVTIQGFEIAGEITGSYIDYAFGTGTSRGIFAMNGVTGFNFTNNNIHDVRTGILIDGRNTGSVTGNVIDNTKSAISVQYTDGNEYGYVIDISGNSQGAHGNEWGVNYHLNGHWDGNPAHSPVANIGNPIAAAPTLAIQQALLDNSAANGGWWVQDQGYTSSNRTEVLVSTTGSASNQGSPRAALNTIQAGINAVVTGGTVHVNDGTYVIPAGGGAYVHITKTLNLIGQSEAGTIIDATGASTYGIRVQADDVSLSDFTVKGPTSIGGYGIKVEPLAGAIVDPNNRLNDFSITNVSIKDSYKTGLDLNGVDGATIDYVTVTGATHGNGIAMTDTANATLTNVSTSGNAWGGLALYQTNNTYNQQVDNITVDASNSFGEANGIYLEDQSASKDYGLLTIAGYDYAASNKSNPADLYTYLQKTQQGAIDILDGVGAVLTGYIQGWTGTATNNTFYVGTSTANHAMSIGTAVTAAAGGATINVGDGTYTVSAANGYANGYLGITKSLTLTGESEAGTIIDARNASTYGIRVINGSDDVSLSNFTLLGVAGTNGYGIKVENVENFSIDQVTSHGAYKAQLDLNGVIGGTVNHFTADGSSNGVGSGSVKGAAIAITDSQDITVENSSTSGGSYGGIAIYQSNKPSGYGYQTDNITIADSNTIGETNAVYMEDESSTNDFGTVTVDGFDYAASNKANPADLYTYFQKTQQGAINILDSVGALAAGYIQDWDGTATDNIFYVGTSTGGHAMSVNAAINAANTGATINVGSGTYNEALNITKSLDILGAGAAQTIIKPTTLLTTGANHKYDTNLKVAVYVNGAGDVNLSGMTIDGNGLGANAIVFWNNASGSITDTRIQNVGAFNGGQTGQGLAVDATGATTSDLALTNVTFENWNKNAIDAVSGGGSTSGGGNITLTVKNSTLTGRGATGTNAQNGILLWERGGAGSTVDATIDNVAISDIDYTGDDATASGVLMYGSPNGSLTVKNSSFDNVGTYIALSGGSDIEADATQGNTFDGVAQSTATLDQLFNIEDRLAHMDGDGLIRIVNNAVFVTAAKDDLQIGIDAASAGDTVNVQGGAYSDDVTVGSARKILFNGSTVNSFTTNVASAIGGAVSAINGFVLNAATTLLSDTTLNGAVTAQSIDGSTAGGQALTINGGSNAVALGNLGATTRLGATNVTGATTSLNGGTYKANALTFNGPSTLTQVLTTFDTSAAGGNVTFTGNLFGTTDNLQSVAFTTGNGDISLQNAGTNSVWLGSMVVTGDDFSAASVYVNGYVSVLTGNQTFTSTTLNSKGGVNSSVGGNASGPIKSDGNVNIVTGGDFDGNITAPSGSVTGGTITGTFTGDTFTFIASKSVDVTANVTTINLTTPSGKVDGTFSNITTGGGPVIVNGKTRSGNTESNPNQIVVEGYTLPAGAIVTPSGEIILPNGMVIGLISPQAGGGAPGSKPKVVIVHSVQKLGELLAQGYVAIIVDLSKNNDEQEELALAD